MQDDNNFNRELLALIREQIADNRRLIDIILKQSGAAHEVGSTAPTETITFSPAQEQIISSGKRPWHDIRKDLERMHAKGMTNSVQTVGLVQTETETREKKHQPFEYDVDDEPDWNGLATEAAKEIDSAS